MRVPANKLVLTTMKRKCNDCGHVQHVFFTSKKEADDWECPECRDKNKESDNIKPEDHIIKGEN